MLLPGQIRSHGLDRGHTDATELLASRVAIAELLVDLLTRTHWG